MENLRKERVIELCNGAWALGCLRGRKEKIGFAPKQELQPKRKCMPLHAARADWDMFKSHLAFFFQNFRGWSHLG